MTWQQQLTNPNQSKNVKLHPTRITLRFKEDSRIRETVVTRNLKRIFTDFGNCCFQIFEGGRVDWPLQNDFILVSESLDLVISQCQSFPKNIQLLLYKILTKS
uniref:Uncharacterized protein n=1 Tax=Micrurus corallinus TaxID=54390 RepID=A0A2D4GL02_MICCO